MGLSMSHVTRDRHYGGLAALELYDVDGTLITPLSHDLGFAASVESINEIPGSVRTIL